MKIVVDIDPFGRSKSKVTKDGHTFSKKAKKLVRMELSRKARRLAKRKEDAAVQPPKELSRLTLVIIILGLGALGIAGWLMYRAIVYRQEVKRFNSFVGDFGDHDCRTDDLPEDLPDAYAVAESLGMFVNDAKPADIEADSEQDDRIAESLGLFVNDPVPTDNEADTATDNATDNDADNSTDSEQSGHNAGSVEEADRNTGPIEEVTPESHNTSEA